MIGQNIFKSTLLRNFEGIPEKCCVICKTYTTKPQLEHVGTFIPKTNQKEVYNTGQTFIHKVLAYRGVILYPWLASIYERKQSSTTSKKESKSEAGGHQKPSLSSETYYQVLMDSRDLKNNQNIVRKEGVTFLHKMSTDRNQCLYTIPGIDYVSHTDIMPYQSVEPVPIQHDLFDQFLEMDSTSKSLKSTEMLNTWQTTHHQCLEVSKVHKETTNYIRVTAIPFFLGMKQTLSAHACDYWWRYSIRIENLGDKSARLRERHWQIVSNGSVKTVRGRGVTGKEPLLTKEHPVFQFSSHISLQSPSGTVWGTFRLEEEDGSQFDAGIPAFALESKL